MQTELSACKGEWVLSIPGSSGITRDGGWGERKTVMVSVCVESLLSCNSLNSRRLSQAQKDSLNHPYSLLYKKGHTFTR